MYKCLVSFLLLFQLGFSQTEKLDEVLNKTAKLFQDGKEDSAFLALNTFLNNKEISLIENFYCKLTYAQLLTERENFPKGMDMMRSARNQIMEQNGNNEKDSLVAIANTQIANAFFTLQQFDSAEYYCLKAQPYLSKTSYEDLSFNSEILGYTLFLKKDYKQSILNYQNSIAYKDKLPGKHRHVGTYCKIALAEYGLGNKTEAFKLLEKCKQICENTKSIGHHIVTYNTLLDIYVQEKDYKKAYETKLVIDEYTQKRAEQNQKKRFDELDIKYQTKFKEQENEGLKIINEEKEKSLYKQKRALIGVSLAAFALVVLLYVVIRLLRQKKRINKDLEQKKKELERLHLLNQKIFAVVSHDFKEPLLNLEMLIKADSNQTLTISDFENQKTQISHQLRQSNLVIENLLSWAKNELGIKGIDTSSSRPYQVVEDLLIQFASSIQNKKVNIENKIPLHLDVQVPIDILKIIFRNLISNAIKYSYKQGVITIGYSAEDRAYFVSDSGTGISDEKLAKLLVIQVDSELGTNYESGHGIGLNLVNELVAKYNGKIWIKSKKDEYTTVFFNFIV